MCTLWFYAVDFIHACVHIVRPLKGSTLVTEGAMTEGSDEWAIYGGTGVFAMARGVIRRTFLADTSGGNSDELAVEVLCPVFRPAAFGSSSSQPAAKVRASERASEKPFLLLTHHIIR